MLGGIQESKQKALYDTFYYYYSHTSGLEQGGEGAGRVTGSFAAVQKGSGLG